MSKVVPRAEGVIGFIRFLKGYYLILVTESKKVAKIGKHNIYKIKKFDMVPLFKTLNNDNKLNELKYV